MPQKIIHKVVETCEDCPFCQIECGDYYCEFEWGEILLCKSLESTNYCIELRKWKDSQRTLFPMTECEKPENPLKIPKWCPLPDYEEDDLK